MICRAPLSEKPHRRSNCDRTNYGFRRTKNKWESWSFQSIQPEGLWDANFARWWTNIDKVDEVGMSQQSYSTNPILPGGYQVGTGWGDGGTMCGDLLCPMHDPLSRIQGDPRKCMRWVGGSFVKATVTLAKKRQHHLCWARHNGVRLLGGYLSPKGRFSKSSK